MSAVVVRAPGKLNVALHVGAPDARGYHPLATVFTAVDLAETVTVEDAADLSVQLTGPCAAGVPVDGGNLAVRAAALLAEHTGVRRGARITLDKEVPVAGGMGGGSADAAATLLALDELWGTRLERADLAALAFGLGADVPFALLGGSALGLGYGEQLTPLDAAPLRWVLAVRDGTLSTPAVYRHLDSHRDSARVPAPAVPEELLGALADGDVAGVADHLHNDLQDAAVDLDPVLGTVLAAARGAGGAGALVSGSGPTIAVLVTGDAEARAVAAALEDLDGVTRCAGVRSGAAGARLVGRTAAH